MAKEIRETEIRKVVWQKAGNPWGIFLTTDRQNESWKGPVGENVTPGTWVKAEGHVGPKEGRYPAPFIVDTVIQIQSPKDDVAGAWMQWRLPEIGEVRAERLSEQFGRSLPDLFDSGRIKDTLSTMSGLTPKRVNAIMEAYREYPDELRVAMWLGEPNPEEQPELGMRWVPIKTVIEEYNKRAGVQQLRADAESDPYELMAIDGITFRSADDLGEALGFEERDPRRLRGMVWEKLEDLAGGEGICVLPRAELFAKMRNFGWSPEQLQQMFSESPHFQLNRFGAQLFRIARAEAQIASKVQEVLAEQQQELPMSLDLPDWLDPSQKDAVEKLQTTPITILTGGPGCHAKGQKLLRADGKLVAVEDVRPGDLLAGPDGPRTVLELKRGHGSMARIVPTKGNPFVVNTDHILTLVHSTKNTISDVSVADHLRSTAKNQHHSKLFRVGVQSFEDSVQDEDLPLDPYFLGVLLGDGCLGPSISVTKNDSEIRNTCEREAKKLGLRLRVQDTGDRCPSYFFTKPGKKNSRVQNPLAVTLKSLNLYLTRSHTKFIPDLYKTSSRQSRLQLLAGLIDTDGYVDSKNCCVDYVSASEILAQDFVFLARSLGFAAYIRSKKASCQTGAVGTYYRVSLSGDLFSVPTKIHRKRLPTRNQKKDALRTGFKVELLPDADDFYGFTLDGDGRYLMDDFTVTHNTGKTTVLKTALDQMEKNGARVLLASPTGKAAKRMTETTGREAKTVHKLLEWTPEGFRRDASNPLDGEVVVVDEASMLDVELASSLFEALGGARLLLVGDVDQLPPVGPGQPLLDLMRSENVPTFRLTKTHRQKADSWVIDNAPKILKGQTPSLQDQGDFQFLRADESDQIVRYAVAMYQQAKEQGPAALKQLQVLTPEHKRGAGTQTLNFEIQKAMNPKASDSRFADDFVQGSGEAKIYVGDKVFYTKNNAEFGLVNGSMGVVEEIEVTADSRLARVRFEGDINPRTGDDLFELRDADIRPLQLAYAMTVHKAQGSEWSNVVVVADKAHFSMRRKLLYTAITRTNNMLTIIGSEEAVARGARNNPDENRATLLQQRLRGEL